MYTQMFLSIFKLTFQIFFFIHFKTIFHFSFFFLLSFKQKWFGYKSFIGYFLNICPSIQLFFLCNIVTGNATFASSERPPSFSLVLSALSSQGHHRVRAPPPCHRLKAFLLCILHHSLQSILNEFCWRMEDRSLLFKKCGSSIVSTSFVSLASRCFLIY